MAASLIHRGQPADATQPSRSDCAGQNPYLRVFKSNVFVRDHDRSIDFYVNRLGFCVVADQRFEFGRWVAIAPPDGSAILALVAPPRRSENYRLIGKPTQIAFIAEDVNATYDLWTSRGVRFEQPPQPQLWGGVFARFVDVDGNSFELLGSDEMSRLIEDQRRAAAERIESERRLEQELQIAREVQARLFPQTTPPLQTLDYAGICVQARHVGGDYYDFLSFGPDRFGLLIGDISGKGIAAALLMANLQANLRSQLAMAREHPELFLRSVNTTFYDNTADSAYSTMFFAEYCDVERRLQYANCGHLPGLLLRTGGEVEELAPTGTVLGLFREWTGHLGTCDMRPGDTLALYTDGVTEACNAGGEEFGHHRLIAALRKHANRSAKETIRAILDDVLEHCTGEQSDDITLIVARCTDHRVPLSSLPLS
ncbi:MAG TPA: SpoIIE family protein phosphatase [Acidobacteriaceae bacterium]